MAASSNKTSQYIDYTNNLKDKILITDFYTKVTGIQFSKIDSRLRACAAWRNDKHPSLTYHEQTNTLTDYAAQSNYRNKIGFVCNHVDILLLTNTCSNRYEATKYLAEYLGETLPKNLDKTIQQYTKTEQSLRDFFKASRENATLLFNENTSKQDSHHIRLYAAERDFPFDVDFFNATEIGVFPNHKTIVSICDKHKISMNKDEPTEGASWAVIPASDYYNQAIVFPLYNEHGNLTGVNIRHVYPDNKGNKRIRKCQIASGQISMYGLNQAINSENVGCMEGEMNRLRLCAHYWNTDKERALKYLKITFCTGSKGNNVLLDKLHNTFKNVLYIPDVSYRNNDKKIGEDTIDVVLQVYNAIKANNFKAIHWGKRIKGFDLDDYLKENKDKADAYTDLLKTSRKSIAEYTKEEIEDFVLNTYRTEDERDSCRFNLLESYCEKFYNNADRIQLKRFYAHISEDDLDTDASLNINSTIRKDLGNGFYIEDGAYYAEDFDTNGAPLPAIKISNFVVNGNCKLIKLSNKDVDMEEKGASNESIDYYATIVMKDGQKFDVIIRSEDIADNRKFWEKLLGACIDIKQGMPRNREADVVYCISQSIITKKERICFKTAGPHIRNFNESELKSVLRKDLFVPGGTLNTFLNKNTSVINGHVYKNKDKNLNLAINDGYCFDECNEEELCKISDIIWYKLRKLHKPYVINSLLGFAFCAPIKHIVDSDIRGLHLYLLGETNSHKTSCARIIQNFFGNFPSDETLSSFANSSLKALAKVVANAGSCIHICDEFKPSADLSIEAMNHWVHAIYNGRSRAILSQKSEYIRPQFYYANVITTAEYSYELETSAEARYLLLNVSAIDTRNIYNEVNKKEVLEKLKCFTPHLIAWQHRNIEEIKEKYNQYKASIEGAVVNLLNSNRISTQLAMIAIGYYSLCKFMSYKNIITNDEAESEAQQFMHELRNNASKQINRTISEKKSEQFLEALSDLIRTKSINVATIKYTANNEPDYIAYSLPNSQSANIIRFRTKNFQAHSDSYAILSLSLLISDIYRHTRKDLSISIKNELASDGIIKLNTQGKITANQVPDLVNNFKEKKPQKSIIIPAYKLFPNGENDDREPESF